MSVTRKLLGKIVVEAITEFVKATAVSAGTAVGERLKKDVSPPRTDKK